MPSEDHPPEEARSKAGDANDAARDSDGDGPESGDDYAWTVDETLPRILTAISEQVGEIRDQLERLLNVQFDRIRLRLRTGFFWLLSSLLLAAFCVVATAAAVLYVMRGLSGLFTALLGGNVWGGHLIAGAAVLLLVLLMVAIFGGRFRRRELARLKRKYEPASSKGERP